MSGSKLEALRNRMRSASTVQKPQSNKGIKKKVECPYCGNEYTERGLKAHLKSCIDNPDNAVEVTVPDVKVSITGEEFTHLENAAHYLIQARYMAPNAKEGTKWNKRYAAIKSIVDKLRDLVVQTPNS